MALGMRPKGRTLFGRTVDMATPGIGDGMTQHSPEQRMAAQPATPPKKPGLFGQGGAGRYMVGAIGDALLQNADMAPVYGPAMQQQQSMAAQMAAEQRKRSLDMADWQAKKRWESENPGQTAMMQNYEYLKGIDPAAAESFLKRQTDPIQWITGPDGVPRPYGVGGQAAPTAPVGKLTPITGGGTGNGVGGF